MRGCDPWPLKRVPLALARQQVFLHWPMSCWVRTSKKLSWSSMPLMTGVSKSEACHLPCFPSFPSLEHVSQQLIVFGAISTTTWVSCICSLMQRITVWSLFYRCGFKIDLWVIDDRGIDVVRNKIKMFAQKKVTLPPGRHKIVLLDEADRWSSGGHKDALYFVLGLRHPAE